MKMKGVTYILILTTFLIHKSYAITIIEGIANFEKVLVTSAGLQLNQKHLVPISYSRVEIVLNSNDQRVIGSTNTTIDGYFQVQVELNNETQIYIRVLAQSENARIVNFTASPSLYSVKSDSFLASPNQSIHKIITADDEPIDDNRGSGPFNILAAINRANNILRAADPEINLPPITIRWSTTYQEGTAFDRNNTIYVNGRRDVDSDEFDDHVIIHEYGHFIEQNFSKVESPGGQHMPADQLDPRLAWSEGWGNFFASACLNDPLYIDTYSEGVLLKSNIEDNNCKCAAGYWNEHSVSSSLWDIFDSNNDERDEISLGFKPIWKTYSGDFRKVINGYLINFCDLLCDKDSILGNRITSILASYALNYSPGKIPSIDNGFPLPLVPNTVVSGTVNSFKGTYTNRYLSSSFFNIKIDSLKDVSIKMDILASDDPNHKKYANLDLYLYDRDMGIADVAILDQSTRKNGVGGKEEINANLGPGTYVIEIRAWTKYNQQGAILDPQDAKFNLTISFK